MGANIGLMLWVSYGVAIVGEFDFWWKGVAVERTAEMLVAEGGRVGDFHGHLTPCAVTDE